MFLGMHPFILGCSIHWYIIVHSDLMILCISVVSIVMSLPSFLTLFALHFFVSPAKCLSVLFTFTMDFPGGSDGKASVYNAGEPGFYPWVGKIPWRRTWPSTAGLLPGKSHGQRSLVGYISWGCKELDRTERLHFHFTKS